MDGEISNFIMVWATILASALYCHAVAKTVAKGSVRLIMFLPVIFAFLVLPFNLNSVHLGCPTVFFISWLANVKLLLLASGNGPLSDPSLTMGSFLIITCFPITLQQDKLSPENAALQLNGGPKNGYQAKSPTPLVHSSSKNFDTSLRNHSHLAKNAIILAILVWLGQRRDRLNRNVVLFSVAMHLYVGLDLMLSIVALNCQRLLGRKLEAPFDDPFLSSSLRDFWGRRWNRAASESLRLAVYWPVYRYSSGRMGRKWALVQALMVTFLVSAMMHELLTYYLVRSRPTLRITRFFLLHGLCLGVEDAAKKSSIELGFIWPQFIKGPLIFGFVVLTSMWLLLPDAMDHRVDARALKEYQALGVFFRDLGTVLVRKFSI